jgi:hypothetical protein
VREEQLRVRRRRSRAEVEQLVREYEGSRLRRTEFCRTHGLALSTLNRYCKRQRARKETAGVGPWVAVELSSPSPAAGSGGSSGLAVILSNGRRIDIGCRFEASTLERLIALLERI